MKGLFVRYLISLLVIGGVIFYILYVSWDRIQEKIVLEYNTENGLMLEPLAQKLSDFPEKEWSELIKEWKSDGATNLHIMNINNVKFNSGSQTKKMKALQNGMVVADSNWFQANYGGILIESSYYYVPIPHSDKVIQVLIFHGQRVDKREDYWFFKSIQLLLEEKPRHEWNQTLKEISSKMPTWSLRVMKLSDITLPHHYKNILEEEGSVLYLPNIQSNHRSNEYYKFNYNGVNYYIEQRWNNIFFYDYHIWFLIIILILTLFVVVFIWVYPFNKSIKRMVALTQDYSNGDFNVNVKVPKSSVMRGLFNNLTGMGKQIQSLLNTNRDLTYGLSHELKTPLSRMYFSLSMIENTKDVNKLTQHIALIKDDIGEMKELIEEMMLYASVERSDKYLKFEQTNLYTWLTQFIESWWERNGLKDYEFIFNMIENENLNILIHRRYLGLALSNIFGNAIKYGYKKLQVNILEKNHQLIIHIDDDGPGISNDDREKVFVPFVRLENDQQTSGHGLGLSIVRQIITLHQGEISITSSPFGGTRFIIILDLI